MSTDSSGVRFRFDRSPAERHIVIAHRRGVWKPLFPKYQAVLPIGEREEVLERVRILAAQDPAFHQHWLGWNFGAFRYDDQLMFLPDGRIVRGGEKL